MAPANDHEQPSPASGHAPRPTLQDPESGWMDALRFRVPADAERHVSANVNLTRVTGAAAERFRQRQAEQRAALAALPPAQEIAASWSEWSRRRGRRVR